MLLLTLQRTFSIVAYEMSCLGLARIEQQSALLKCYCGGSVEVDLQIPRVKKARRTTGHYSKNSSSSGKNAVPKKTTYNWSLPCKMRDVQLFWDISLAYNALP